MWVHVDFFVGIALEWLSSCLPMMFSKSVGCCVLNLAIVSNDMDLSYMEYAMDDYSINDDYM